MSGSANSEIHFQFIGGSARVQNGHSYAPTPTRTAVPGNVQSFDRPETESGPSAEITKRIIQTLQFEQMNVRRQNIRRPCLGTCDWFTKTPEYGHWADSSQVKSHGGFLWIKGNPGAGKTILMNHLLENSRANLPQAEPISFFFNANGNELERSTLGLYRTLLCQLFLLLPNLTTTFSELGYASPDYIEKNGWQEQGLQNLLHRVVRKLGNQDVVCYIDALDEGSETEVREMISFFEDIVQETIRAGKRFSVCFSSRRFPHISTKHHPQLILETQDEHALSIQRYVNSELEPLLGESELTDEIRDEIGNKASGIFLWVSIVVPKLKMAFDQGEMAKLQETLRNFPSKLGNLYHEILFPGGDTIDDSTVRCLQWVLFSQRPLTLRELYTATQLGLDYGNFGTIAVDNIRRRILHLSRGLVQEIASGANTYVHFIHESVRDFLLQKDGLQRLQLHQRNDVESTSHEMLKKTCLRQLESIESTASAILHRRPGYSHPLPNDPRHKWRSLCLGSPSTPIYPFLEYAVANVFTHAEQAQKSVDQLDFMKHFPLNTWVELHNALIKEGFTRTGANSQPGNVTMLHILAEKNLYNLARRHPDRLNHLQAQGGRYRLPLIAALACGSHAVAYDLGVQAFIDGQILVALEPEDEEYFWALSPCTDFNPCHPSLLICFVQLNCVTAIEALTQHGENLKQVDSTGKTPLHWAIESGSVDAALWLLANEPANLHVADKQGTTPLACACKHLKRRWDGKFNEYIIDLCDSMMQMPNVDLECVDDFGRTPLSYTAESGCVELARTLVCMLQTTGQVDTVSACHEGRIPLSYAAGESRSLEMVELLLSCNEASVHSQDIHGRTPLSHAAGAFRLRPDIVRSLIGASHAEIECRDHTGRTPLSYAVECGLETTVRVILDTGIAVVDSRDNYGRTPVSYAAAKGSPSILQALLSAGSIEFDSEDHLGRTPLSYAAQAMTEEVLDALLATDKVFTDSRDKTGRTPLRWAIESDILWSVNKKCRSLLTTGRVDICAVADDGRTPLDAAKRRLSTATGLPDSNSVQHRGSGKVLEACIDLMNAYKETGSVPASMDPTEPEFRLGHRIEWNDQFGRLHIFKN